MFPLVMPLALLPLVPYAAVVYGILRATGTV